MKPGAAASSRERILFYLKTKGPQTAQQLADRLELTAMGARQHLALLEEEGRVRFEEERRPVGRPARVWRLTARGHAEFPEGYAELAVGLLGAMRGAFGAAGVERLVEVRTREQKRRYRERLDPGAPLARRVAALAKLRTEEGYMAAWSKRRDGSFELIENHCPICAAAELCQGLCSAELELFQASLGGGARVERTEHLLDGARRCVYRIRPAK